MYNQKDDDDIDDVVDQNDKKIGEKHQLDCILKAKTDPQRTVGFNLRLEEVTQSPYFVFSILRLVYHQ